MEVPGSRHKGDVTSVDVLIISGSEQLEPKNHLLYSFLAIFETFKIIVV